MPADAIDATGPGADTDLSRLRTEAYADPDLLDDRRAIYAYQDPRPDFYGWILDQVDWPAEGTVLDLGCGPGTHLALLGARRARLRLVGADASEGMLAAARRAEARVDPVAVDAIALPFVDASFGAVMANHMLYHVSDLHRTVAEVRRVLADGGSFLAVTNALDHFEQFDDLLRRAGDRPGFARPSGRFNTEHSGADLAAHFTQVSCHEQVGELVVPDLDPLVRFARSMRPMIAIGVDDAAWGAWMTAFEELAAAQIDRTGALRITTHTGAFVCR